MPLKILIYPNQKLCEKTKKIKVFDKKLAKLAEEMTEKLFANKGIGLAAPQVEKAIRLIVIEFNPERFKENNKTADEKSEQNKLTSIPLTILVNPKIISHSSTYETLDEGCLSFPNLELPISRYKRVKVLAQDLNGNRIKIRAKELFARILQHEIDHLNGILIINRISATKLKKILREKRKHEKN